MAAHLYPHHVDSVLSKREEQVPLRVKVMCVAGIVVSVAWVGVCFYL